MTWATIHTVLPWLLSATTLCMMWLAGNLNRWAWALGLGNQCLWFLYTVAVWQAVGFWAALGLLPMNIGFTVVYYRNHVKWGKL